MTPPRRARPGACVAAALLILSGCVSETDSDPRLSGPRPADLDRMGASPAPPRLIAAGRAEVEGIAAAAARLDAETVAARRGFRRVEISALPYLRSSLEGARFLGRAGPRALARGAPAAACPISGVSPPGAKDRRAAAAAALSSCLARAQGPECGCRLLAVDDILLAPRADFVFAPVVSAYLIGGPAGARALVAEAAPPAGDVEEVILRDAQGAVGALILNGDAARLTLGGVVYEGRREPFGYRRGRIAERLRLTGPGGARRTVLIGVERRDAIRSR